jgi:hypothetical protein
MKPLVSMVAEAYNETIMGWHRPAKPWTHCEARIFRWNGWS